MGAEISREFATEATACADRGAGLEEILEDPKWTLRYGESTKAMKKLLGEASKKDRLLESNGEELASYDGGELLDSTKSRGLSTIEGLRTSDICIARNLRPHIDEWNQRPERLLDHTSIITIFKDLRVLERRRADEWILICIYAVALYDLHCNNRPRGPTSLKRRAAKVINDSPLVRSSPKAISNWVEMMVRFGQRMRALADDNGGLGSLLTIPPEALSMRQWNRLNGKELRQAISHFQDIKVCDAVQEEPVLEVADRMHSQVLKDFSRQIFGHGREEHGEKAQISMQNSGGAFSNLQDHSFPTEAQQVTASESTDLPSDQQTSMDKRSSHIDTMACHDGEHEAGRIGRISTAKAFGMVPTTLSWPEQQRTQANPTRFELLAPAISYSAPQITHNATDMPERYCAPPTDNCWDSHSTRMLVTAESNDFYKYPGADCLWDSYTDPGENHGEHPVENNGHKSTVAMFMPPVNDAGLSY